MFVRFNFHGIDFAQKLNPSKIIVWLHYTVQLHMSRAEWERLQIALPTGEVHHRPSRIVTLFKSEFYLLWPERWWTMPEEDEARGTLVEIRSRSVLISWDTATPTALLTETSEETLVIFGKAKYGVVKNTFLIADLNRECNPLRQKYFLWDNMTQLARPSYIPVVGGWMIVPMK